MIAKAVRYLMFRFGCLAVHLRRPGQIRAAFRQAQSLAGRTVPDGRRALLLPTASPGNLGDAALFIGTVKELRAMGFDRVCVVSFAEDQRYEIQGADTVILNLHHNPTGQAYLDFVKLASAFTHFLVWGADIVDGTHGIEVVSNRQTLANLAATMGLHTTICSFSVSPKRSVPAMDGYRTLHPDVRLYCRDAFSLERLAQEIPGRPPALSADLAFLLRPDHDQPQSIQVAEWAAQQRQSGKIILGLNINDLFCSYFDIPKQKLLHAYSEAITELAPRVPPFALIHLPHDTHPNKQLGTMTDFTLARELNALLPDQIRDSAFIPSETLTAPEVRSICTRVDLIFSARMHLSIASLAVGTPVFGLAYQGKFEGLFRHFGLQNMWLEAHQILNLDETVAFLVAAFERYPAVRAQVESKLPEVLHLARRNLDF
jgi:polysaccharide pyruvyl transferase WcaK-like protein